MITVSQALLDRIPLRGSGKQGALCLVGVRVIQSHCESHEPLPAGGDCLLSQLVQITKSESQINHQQNNHPFYSRAGDLQTLQGYPQSIGIRQPRMEVGG